MFKVTGIIYEYSLYVLSFSPCREYGMSNFVSFCMNLQEEQSTSIFRSHVMVSYSTRAQQDLKYYI